MNSLKTFSGQLLQKEHDLQYLTNLKETKGTESKKEWMVSSTSRSDSITSSQFLFYRANSKQRVLIPKQLLMKPSRNLRAILKKQGRRKQAKWTMDHRKNLLFLYWMFPMPTYVISSLNP